MHGQERGRDRADLGVQMAWERAAGLVRAGGTWRWSDELYGVLGFAAGEVPGTPEVLLTHVDPADREAVRALLDGTGDGPVGLSLHLLDARGGRRAAVLAGTREGDDLRLVLVDVTDAQARHDAEARAAAVAEASVSRAVIDQAIGALRLLYGLAEPESFALLTWASQRTGTKVRAVAEQLVETLAGSAPLPDEARRALDRVVTEVAGGWSPRGPAVVGSPPPTRRTTSVATVQERLPGLTVVSVTGEVDMSTGAALSTPLLAALAGCARSDVLVVDVSRTDHLGPVATSLLSVLARRSARNGVLVRVVAPPALAAALRAEGVEVHPRLQTALRAR